MAAAVALATARAEHLGVYGNVWPIAEQDAVEAIKSRLKKMERDGQLDAFWKNYRDKAIAGLQNPPPVPGITRAQRTTVRMFDPSYQFLDVVRDTQGNVIVPAGKKFNPFDYVDLDGAIIFIDGRDPQQVAWAKKRVDANPHEVVILVAGEPFKLSREWDTPVYYDQMGGMFSKRFGIRHVPSLLQQKGRVLEITEVGL